MTQERLNGMVIIALENDILMIKYEDIFEDFISKYTKKIMINVYLKLYNKVKVCFIILFFFYKF